MKLTTLKFAGAAVAVLGMGIFMATAPGLAQQSPPPGPSGAPPSGSDSNDNTPMGPGGRWVHRGMMMGPMDRPGERCGERISGLAQRRVGMIERVVKPTDAQRQAFADFKTATSQAADIMRGACPTEVYLTPPGRLESAEKVAEARLRAIRVVRPALENFYRSLSDEQKAHFNAIRAHRTPKWAGEWRERWTHAWQDFRDHERGAWRDRGSNDRGSWHRRSDYGAGSQQSGGEQRTDGRTGNEQGTDGRGNGRANLDQPNPDRQGSLKQPDSDEGNSVAPSDDEERM